MILSKEVNVFVNNKIITYYRNLGYDIIFNNFNIIKVEDLHKKSNVKIDVKCDICGKENNITCQKYTKNISKYNLYTCINCSSMKNKMTYKEKYGIENYVNTEKLKEMVKIKYDIITEEIKHKGTIKCIKCDVDKQLSEYILKNNRYKHICKDCRTIIVTNNKKIRKMKNPDAEKLKNRNYYHNVLKTTKKYKLAWRNMLKSYLKRIGCNKQIKTNILLGYSAEEFKSHIENQFMNDMTWENHGKIWHVDHIIQIAFFKIDTPANIVNSLKNLRPLYSFENLSRGLNIIDYNLVNEFKLYLDLDKLKLYNHNIV